MRHKRPVEPQPWPNPAPDPDQVYWENKFPAYKCGGNYGVPACTQDPAKFRELQLAELKNGRLAMIGIISFATAEALPGSVQEDMEKLRATGRKMFHHCRHLCSHVNS